MWPEELMVARGFVVRTFLRLSGGRFRAERDDLAGLCVDQDFGDILTLRPNDIEGPDESVVLFLNLRALDLPARHLRQGSFLRLRFGDFRLGDKLRFALRGEPGSGNENRR